MKQIYNDIVQYRGSHYDFGIKQGERLKNSLTVKNRSNQWKVRKPRFTVEEKEVQQAITRFAPGVWDELAGIRDSLEWTMDDVLKEFGGYRLNYVRSGCSIMTGDGYLVRNYDYHPKTYDGRFTAFQPDDQGYAIIGPSQRITGRMDGMNEKGLTLGYNFMNRKRPGAGFICCMIGRLVLESCANVEEAVMMLKEIPHRHSFSYVVYDKNGETFVIEASPREVKLRQSTICTNHFEIMEKENRYHLVDSMRRLDILKKQKRNMQASEAFRLLNGKENKIFSEDYNSWAGTIHTSAYFPEENKAWFALGGNAEPVEFNFGSWLKGKNFEHGRIEGEVNTTIPFVHMDSNADWFKREE